MTAAAFIISVLASATSAGPLAPATQGMIQCFEPDDLAKTCHSIAAYRQIGESIFANDAAVLVSPTSAIIFESTMQVELKENAVCGVLSRENYTNGRLRVGNTLVPRAKAEPALAQIAAAAQPFIGKQICSYFLRKGDMFTANAVVDGVERPDFQKRGKWVKASDGYTVSP
jgi:hypothetical protein